MNKPHQVSVAEIEAKVGLLSPTILASATTADGTQHKRLVLASPEQNSFIKYVVTRYYFVEMGNTTSDVVYEGEALYEAVRVYNQLS